MIMNIGHKKRQSKVMVAPPRDFWNKVFEVFQNLNDKLMNTGFDETID